MTAPVFHPISAPKLSELPPAEVLCGTKFIEQGLNVVFGPSGAFKSFFTLDACLRIAQEHPVFYVAAEGSRGLYRRVAAWCKYYEIDVPDQLHFLTQEVNLLNAVHVKALVDVCRGIKPALVVFDTLARCITGGDENSAKDMGVAVSNSTYVQRELNTAVVWIHHTNKAERGERGSGAIRGAADAMVELTAAGDSIIRVSCSKLKDDEPWSTEEYRFFPVGASGVLLPNYGDEDKFSAIEFQILEFIGMEIFEPMGAKALQLVNGLNISERQVYRMLSHLKRELTITHDSKGDPYRLTDRGKEIVRQRSAKPARVLKFVQNQGVTESTDITAIN